MNLSDSEKAVYLANLIAVSRVDGSVAPCETRVVEAAQKRLGAGEAELKKAKMMAASDGFQPQPVGSFSVRVANLEDAVMVSLVDGVLDLAEKPMVFDFAERVGVTSDQLQLILSEVGASLTSPK